MMDKKKHTHRKALTMSVLLYIFLLLLLTAIISFIAVSAFVSLDMVPLRADGVPEPRNVMLFMLGVNIIAGLCIISLANHVLLKYINRIIDQMNRLSSGDFSARLSFKKPLAQHPTFLEVTNSFNKMAEELENTEMLRSDFINNFSHEFKTPIVSIAGFAKLLKHGNLSEEQRAEYLDIIEVESLRLSAMATNALNMTKVENQSILTNVTEYNLSEQIRNSVLILEPKWTKKHIDFELHFDEVMVLANEELLKHVWVNLIDNAIKFSPKSETIEISIKEEEKYISVSVLNRGSEIPLDKQKYIFNKFYQAEESHVQEGNGVGLALAKKVVSLHQGSISVESENMTTVFTILLPKTR